MAQLACRGKRTGVDEINDTAKPTTLAGGPIVLAAIPMVLATTVL